MSFKTLFVSALAMVLGLGCAKREHPAYTPIAVELGGGEGCISRFSLKLSAFTQGKMTPENVVNFWNCMSTSIRQFEEITGGPGGSDNYSAESIRKFFEQFFLSSKMSNSMLAGIMNLKRVLLSGSNENLTRAELQRLSSLFEELKMISLDLQPHVDVIFRNKKGASELEVRAASASVRAALMRLYEWLNRQHQEYRFDQIQNLADAIAQWTDKGTLAKIAAVFPEIKVILIAGSEESIKDDEWYAVVDMLSHAFSLYLEFANGFDQSVDAAFNRENLLKNAVETVGLLMKSANAHEGNKLPEEEFAKLFAKIEAQGLLPEGMTAASLDNIFAWFSNRFLKEGQSATHGLTLRQLASLQKIFVDWSALRMNAADDELEGAFFKILQASPPMQWDDEGRLQFLPQTPAEWTPQARARLIWPYLILRKLVTGYADASVTFLTGEQMLALGGEVLPLLQGFGWMKDAKPTLGSRILQEADLFTNASNGDAKFDLAEGARYVGFIVSSVRMAQVWLANAEEVCGSKQAACVRKAGELPQVLSNLPRLQAAMATWKPEFFANKYMFRAEVTALGRDPIQEFATGELLQVAQLFQYVETFFGRFDKDQSEILNLTELNEAYPLFESTLRTLVVGKLVQEEELYAFFTFLFLHGTTPISFDPENPDSLGAGVEFIYWRGHREKWELKTDRAIIMSILYELSLL